MKNTFYFLLIQVKNEFMFQRNRFLNKRQNNLIFCLYISLSQALATKLNKKPSKFLICVFIPLPLCLTSVCVSNIYYLCITSSFSEGNSQK